MAIVITGGQTPDDDTLQKAEGEEIPILMWPGSSFDLAGDLHVVGVQNPESEQP